MVPPEASHTDEEPGVVDDELGYAFHYKRQADAASYSDTGSDMEPLNPDNTDRRPAWRRRPADGHEFKPEIDTGEVSDSCFSWRKLWKYTGPGRTSVYYFLFRIFTNIYSCFFNF